MAIEIRESFQVSAPVDAVWTFMKQPENLANCMPGASLARIIDDKGFVGTVKLKVGAITACYVGTMTFTRLDDAAYAMTLLAQAKEKGGGTVSGTISAVLEPLADGGTEVRCESSTRWKSTRPSRKNASARPGPPTERSPCSRSRRTATGSTSRATSLPQPASSIVRE